MGLTEVLSSLMLKGFIYPCGKKLHSTSGTVLSTPANSPEQCHLQFPGQATEQLGNHDWDPEFEYGSQCREQESVWYACGCFELLRTHTAVFCSSRVSWGLVAWCQVHSTPADLRAGYVSECFPLPPDLSTSQNGKWVSLGIFPEASELMHSCSKTQLIHSCPFDLGICTAQSICPTFAAPLDAHWPVVCLSKQEVPK